MYRSDISCACMFLTPLRSFQKSFERAFALMTASEDIMFTGCLTVCGR